MTMSRSDLLIKATTIGSLPLPPPSILELPPKASSSTPDSSTEEIFPQIIDIAAIIATTAPLFATSCPLASSVPFFTSASAAKVFSSPSHNYTIIASLSFSAIRSPTIPSPSRGRGSSAAEERCQGIGVGTTVIALVAVDKEGKAEKHAMGDEDDRDGESDLLGGDDGRGGLRLGGGGRDGTGRGGGGGERGVEATGEDEGWRW